MTLRERVQARDPAIGEFFDAAERVGYRAGWEHTQNLTLYHDNVPVGGWNSAAGERHWYIAMRWLGGANAALVGNVTTSCDAPGGPTERSARSAVPKIWATSRRQSRNSPGCGFVRREASR